ncbi:hypothetical protein BAA08_12835 [Bizionia sp. APA-3]|nr:hypothetical protein BAA08_12835 [Bizionia sp. APA-3]
MKKVFLCLLNKEVRTPTNSEESNFNNNIIKYNLDNELNNVNQVRIPDAGSGCKSPCSKTSKGQCSYVNDSPRPSYYKCVRTTVDDCPWSRMSNNENETNIIYELRDQYLAQNSNLGQKYVDYYYFLGSNQNLFTNEIWDELSQIKPLILEKANLFIFGENNKILFDNKDKNEFISVINKLKTINSDIEFQNMLNDVNLDLNFYANKKISEIKNDLN